MAAFCQQYLGSGVHQRLLLRSGEPFTNCLVDLCTFCPVKADRLEAGCRVWTGRATVELANGLVKLHWASGWDGARQFRPRLARMGWHCMF